MVKKKYELIEHTADIGIRAYGEDLSELFCNAALGMFEIIADLKNVKSEASFKVSIKEETCEDLMVSWLRELLYIYNSKNTLLRQFRIKKINENSLEAEVSGEKTDFSRHELKTEIKAATYSELKLEKSADGFSAQIIFDV